ncbi:hypothetical protein [Virgibacillus proomii]|uniref:hypothetical protein n=1 Tax=Virgibacillus proomii TaxID=84407 RepID=UPI001C113B9F|nr:hypothetical protein [Virgibacillus proomii]MBU5267298.1 hypothetical protein [Virgibacillus proomii]
MDTSFGIKSLTDTSFFLKHLQSLSAMSTGKRGPNKSPDFLILDNNYNIHLLECKETQNKLTTSEDQIDKGRIQKHSIIDPNTIISEKLVIGTYIAKPRSTRNSRVKIVDPEFKYNFSDLTKEIMINLLLLSQLIKELSFIMSKNFLKVSPRKTLLKDILESRNFFKKIKSLFLKSNLTRKNIEVNEQFGEFSLEKSYNLDVINSH